jgi:hypothetical protein
MKVGDLITLDKREVGGAWNEYLCLEKISEGYELSTRHREILDDAGGYYDEEGDIELPDEIDGESVYGEVCGIIVGESLIINDFLGCGEEGMGSIKFNDVKDENVKSFLQCLDWYDEGFISDIENLIK